MKGVEYPVSIHDRNNFGKQYPSISVSILAYSDSVGVYPQSISKEIYKREHYVNLLLLEKTGNDIIV